MQILREGMHDPLEDAVVDPPLKATMTRLVRRIPVGQILPRRARAKDPQDPIQHIARIAPRPSPSIATQARLRQERREDRPLGVGQVHTAKYDGRSYFVHTPRSRFVR
ncbi:MAG: hypothetical protein FD124_3827 [Alphaproteobacteria bacterium]|nr:MAG: hypothetical protein FD124_3827 [Alphaproteobacteria bacterium]